MQRQSALQGHHTSVYYTERKRATGKPGNGNLRAACRMGKKETTARKDLAHKNLQRGSLRSCTRTKEHNDGLQVSPTVWTHAAVNTLDIGIRIGYTQAHFD